MRGDEEYIGGVLDELETIVQEASGVPMRRGWAVLDRADLLVLLDELREALPAELAEAEAVRRECGAAIREAREEARRIVGRARESAEARAWNTQRCQQAQRRAAEAIDRAQQYAEKLLEGSEAYQDRIMDEMEDWLQDSITSVSQSRRELSGASAQPVPSDYDEDDGRGWQASSA